MLFVPKNCFIFVNRKKNRLFAPKFNITDKMKDRIKQIMESQHMTQQVFADFIGIAPATLSGIFTERTKPTINTIEAIKRKLPSLSTDWLMFGKEPMYVDQASTDSGQAASSGGQSHLSGVQGTESLFDFPASNPSPTPQTGSRTNANQVGVRNTRLEIGYQDMNNFDKAPRKVTEIRVFYNDDTWESFVPAKK